jgi:hypothetical protein
VLHVSDVTVAGAGTATATDAETTASVAVAAVSSARRATIRCIEFPPLSD